MESFVRQCKICQIDKPVSEFMWQKGKKVFCCVVCRRLKVKQSKELSKSGELGVGSISKRSDKFKADGLSLHCGMYTYDRVVYINNQTPVEIFCTKHNKYFWQTPANHTSGKRCPDCAKEVSRSKRLSNTEEFVAKAIQLHKTAYNYTKSIYIDATTQLEVICNKCDESFWQTPNTHLSGCGCPRCAKYGYSVDRPGSIYVLSCDNITKVGITNRSVEERLKGISKSFKGFSVEYCQRFDDGAVASSVEYAIKVYLRWMYRGVDQKFDGYTECFLDVDTQELIQLIRNSTNIIQGAYGNN